MRVATNLRVEIHPDRKAATIDGSYRLVNRSTVAIDSVHLEPAFYVDTRITFDRAFRQVVADDEIGHDIYALEEPLQPGDSLTLSFDVKFEPRGFTSSGPRTSGAGTAILENGTYFTSGALPLIGYQRRRELSSAGERREHGLPARPAIASLDDVQARFSDGDADAVFRSLERRQFVRRERRSSVGEETDTVEDVVEPYLLQLGFLRRTPRGRVATEHAYRHLGASVPGTLPL